MQWLGNFEATLHRLMAEAEVLYLNDNQHTRANSSVETREIAKTHELEQNILITELVVLLQFFIE